MVGLANTPPKAPKTLAAAASRSGIFHLADSFRFREPRGAYCHAGWCQQCKVRLADGRVGLACQLEPEALSQLLPPSRVGRLFGFPARLLRPWFHEAINLKFDALQAFFLFAVRRASGALRLSAARPPAGKRRWQNRTCQSVVVGGGEAGRTAALLLSSKGEDVILVELDPATADRAPVAALPGIALGLYPDDASPSGFHLLCVGQDGSTLVRFEKLVVAVGGYERLPFMRKSALPGIITASAFETLAAQSALPAASKVAVFAPTQDIARIADSAASGGYTIVHYLADGPCEHASVAKVSVGVHPVAALGRKRLRGIELSDGCTIACDILVVGHLQPAYEFQIQAGRSVAVAPGGGALSASGVASFPLLVVGRAAGMRETGDIARAVDDWLSGAEVEERAEPPMPCPDVVDDAVVACPCEDVRVGDIRAACRSGFDSVEHVKRRTGAGTGPCQGKLCHSLLARVLVEEGCSPALPTIRPLARPQRIASFAGKFDE